MGRCIILHCISHFIDVHYWNTYIVQVFCSRFRIFYCRSFLARARSFMCILYKSGDKSFLARRQVTAWNPFSSASRASVKTFANKNTRFLLKSSCAQKIKQKGKNGKIQLKSKTIVKIYQGLLFVKGGLLVSGCGGEKQVVFMQIWHRGSRLRCSFEI